MGEVRYSGCCRRLLHYPGQNSCSPMAIGNLRQKPRNPSHFNSLPGGLYTTLTLTSDYKLAPFVRRKLGPIGGDITVRREKALVHSGMKTRPGTGSLHREAIGAAGGGNKAPGAPGEEGRQ